MKFCKLRAISWILRFIIFIYVVESIISVNFPAAMFFFVVLLLSLIPMLRKMQCGNTDIICILDLLLFIMVLFHVIGIAEGFSMNPYFSLILHFTGGFILGGLIFSFLYFLNHAKITHIPFYLVITFTISLALSFGVLWEFFEFGWDYFITQGSTYNPAQISLADTMADLFWDIVGSLIAVLIFVLTINYESTQKLVVQGFKWLLPK
jgi:hypothetical protein